MNNFDIIAIEELVRKMHVDAPGDVERKQAVLHFWHDHVQAVVELSAELAKKYHADVQLVRLAALLHDISLIENQEPHDELSATKAYYFLVSENVPEAMAQQVKNIVLRHRAKVFVPETLEEKILATADAIAHFLPQFYLSEALGVAREDFALLKKMDIEKLEKEYELKVFFDDEKKMFRQLMAEYQEQFYQ